MALLGIIRRWHLLDKVSLREIAKRLGMFRNTVRRYLRLEITELVYLGGMACSNAKAFGLYIGSNPYEVELTQEAGLTRGGDGGCSACGGMGFLSVLICAEN